MPHLQPGDHVWVKDMLERGTVVSTAGALKSYVIETPRGTPEVQHNSSELTPGVYRMLKSVSLNL